MKKNQKRSRRVFLHKSIQASAVLWSGGTLLSSCASNPKKEETNKVTQPEDPCEDLSDVSAEEIQKRENLGYVKESPIPDNHCENCNLFLPKDPDKSCGGCILFKGPVHAGGYCTYWAPKV